MLRYLRINSRMQLTSILQLNTERHWTNWQGLHLTTQLNFLPYLQVIPVGYAFMFQIFVKNIHKDQHVLSTMQSEHFFLWIEFHNYDV